LKERELKIHVIPSVGRRGEDLDQERSGTTSGPEILLEVRWAEITNDIST
jgi:hypothetical protein